MPEYPWIIYRMSEGPLTVKEVHQGVNEQLNRKLGTDWGYSEYEWAELLQGFRPLPIKTASGSIAHFTDGADDVPLKSLTAQIVPIQSGTGDPSPSNPRPISGTSVLNVEQIQNQLIYATAEDSGTISGIDWSFSNGYLKLNGTSTASITLIFNLSDSVNLNPSDNRILFNNNANNSGVVVFFRRGTSTIHYWGMSPANRIGINWTDTGNENVDNVMVSITPNNTLNNFVVFPCLMLKTEEPIVTPVPLGRTVYGGSAEVVEGSGNITHIKKRLLHTDNWETAQNAFYLDNFFTDMTSAFATSKQNPKCKCNIYIENDVVNYSGNVNDRDNYSFFNQLSPYQNRLWVKDSTFSTLSDFLDYLENNEVYMIIPLSTPTDFTFTGQPINSFEGVNNVWTDSGDVAVEYRSNF